MRHASNPCWRGNRGGENPLTQNPAIRLPKRSFLPVRPGIQLEAQILGEGLGDPGKPTLGRARQTQQQLSQLRRLGQSAVGMETQPDLGFLEFTEVAVGGLQPPIPGRSAAGGGGKLQLSQAVLQLETQGFGAFSSELAGLPVLIEQGLQGLEIAMQAGSSQGRREVIKDHGLAAALGLAALPRIVHDEGIDDGKDVVLVTKDLPLRVKASSVGVEAEEYLAELVSTSGWTGIVELTVGSNVIDDLYASDFADHEEAHSLPIHTGVVLHSDRASALARVTPDKRLQLVRGDRTAFGLHGRSAEQRIALDLLLDPEIGIISMGGRAGTGKSALALCAGLEAVMERRAHKKIVIFRPLYPVGGQELGYLPGSEGEKMSPWAQAVFDTLGALVSQPIIDEIISRGLIEVLPLTHIRGRSLHDSFVIVDEAQSLERGVLLTVLSRIGQGSRVVLTHDVGQRDNLRVGRHDGVVAVVETLKGHPLFAHITLTRSERSAIAALVTEMLEGPISG